ncbi:MAG: phosphoglycerate transporter protein PgtP [Waddliaceae bacterium]
MSSFFSLFKPVPHINLIQDSKVVDEKYQYWRIRILYSMFFGYAFYYFTRKSFTFAMPGMISELGFDKGQVGILASVLSITYGVSKFVSGVISDRSNPRYFMAFGLMMTGVFNIFFGLSSSLYMFILFWGLNGWFQGFGWPPCAKFLTHWYSRSERGRWWSTWNVSHNVGAFIIPWIAGICLQYYGWRYAMYVPGVLCLLGGLFLINRLRDTPQSLGLPPIEQYRNDYSGGEESEKELSTKEILFEFVLKNKFIWVLAFAYFFVYFVRTGVNDWTAMYLIEEKGYTPMSGTGCVSLFEVGGFVGSLAAGWSSDYFFSAKRGPVNALFALGIVFSVLLFQYAPVGYPWMDSFSIFMLGFCIFGPQMLIGVAAAELSHKKAAATATGFVGFFAYIGASISGYPLGRVIDVFGWNGFFMGLIITSLCSLILLLPLWSVTSNDQDDAQPEAEFV